MSFQNNQLLTACKGRGQALGTPHLFPNINKVLYSIAWPSLLRCSALGAYPSRISLPLLCYSALCCSVAHSSRRLLC